jgi:hypothetical protein
MAEPKRSLKQIAKRYSGNLAYFKETHYFRRLRTRLWGGVALAAALVAVVWAAAAAMQRHQGGSWSFAEIYSPGPISQAHASFASDCAQCHQVRNAVVQNTVESSPVDTACIQCHQSHELHQPNVPRSHSCTACHHEHRGSGAMKPVTDANCASCHNDAAIMARSSELGKDWPAEAFDHTPPDGRVHFRLPRPGEGYTAVFASFENGHPPFQIHREKTKDANTLKFNHKVHLGDANMPQLNGKPLDCASCHQPDASGAGMQAMTFERNCQSCHSLQFDPRNPDLHLPHGSVESVRAFITSLPLQYAEQGRKAGIRSESELREYVTRQLTALKADIRSGEELEKKIFFSDAQRGPVGRLTGMADEGRARYAGCAYCHEVKGLDTGIIELTAPVTPDRWLARGEFDHSKHTQVDCQSCHQVTQSELTSDILLPEQASCVQCHSSKGGVVASCQTCHGYHAPAASPGALFHQTAVGGSLKSMMLGSQ